MTRSWVLWHPAFVKTIVSLTLKQSMEKEVAGYLKGKGALLTGSKCHGANN
jgi:hypothetical protein